LIWLFAGAAILGLIIYRTWIYTPATDTLKVIPFRVSGGWGYDVAVKGKTYIHQPFVPGIRGRRPFPDRKTALKAGKMMKAKMMTGRVPALTPEDLVKIGIDTIQ
jgi:hypothetical protein